MTPPAGVLRAVGSRLLFFLWSATIWSERPQKGRRKESAGPYALWGVVGAGGRGRVPTREGRL